MLANDLVKVMNVSIGDSRAWNEKVIRISGAMEEMIARSHLPGSTKEKSPVKQMSECREMTTGWSGKRAPVTGSKTLYVTLILNLFGSSHSFHSFVQRPTQLSLTRNATIKGTKRMAWLTAISSFMES